MNLEITDEWLLSFDKTPEPSGYITPRERASVALAGLTPSEEITLSDRDYELFTKIMTEEREPTELALRGAAEFRAGTMEGTHYFW